MSKFSRMMLLNSGSKKTSDDREENERRNWQERRRDYNVDDRFRDTNGREHYDNGRYAPQDTMPYYYPPYGGYDDRGGREPGYTLARNGGYAEPIKTTRPIGFERGDAPYMGGADATVPRYNEMERMPGNRAMTGGAESDVSPRFDMQMAQEWTRRMQNEDGTTGPHWTIDQTNKVMEQRGVNEDPVKFWAAMNMIYSDFVNVAKKLGISNVDFYTEMTRAFLDDKDISGDKLAKYYEYVVK